MTPNDNPTLAYLDQARFREYRKHLVRNYSADKVHAGTWSAEEADTRSAQDVDVLLPEGTATRGHFL